MITIIVLGSVFGLLILFYLSCFVANKIVGNSIYGRRGDASISIKYALPSDFTSLEVKKSYFENNKKARLTIFEYKKKESNPKGLVLVSHGIGGGHYYLLPLINYLCDKGLLVLAYDQYASGTSEGKKIMSMYQGAIDIKYAVKYVESHYDLPFYVLGHSWGGFCAAQALRYSKKIIKCVDIAGLDSEAAMAQGNKLVRAFAMMFVKLCGFTTYGKYAFYSSLGAFKKTSAKVLYLQGKEDNVVNPKYSGYLYQSKLKNKENIKVIMLDKKGHSPIVNFESQLAQAETMKQFGLLGGNLVPLETYVDFNKNNIPDENVYKLIGDFLID